MIAVATTGTATGCPYNLYNFRCGNCGNYSYYSIHGVTIIICNRCQSVSSDVTYTLPEPTEDDFYLFPKIDLETIRLWRELSRQRPKCRINYIVKPFFKRRLLNSKSGWIARVGYRKKRGK